MHIIRNPLTTADPFDLTKVEDHIRVSGAEGALDAYRCALAAAAEIEQFAQLALLKQAVTVHYEEWPGDSFIRLPIAPVLIADVATFEVTASGVTFDDYQILPGLRPVLRLTGAAPSGFLSIQYEAGWEAPELIPPDLQHAIFDQAAAFYDLRGASDNRVSALSPHTARVVARYRRVAL